MSLETDTGAAILRAILEEPGEDVHRFAYADWLEEQGECLRAGFIRAHLGAPGVTCGAQCGHRGPGDWQILSLGLAPGLDRALSIGLPPFPGVVTFRRGFAERAGLPLQDFLDRAEELFSAHPITWVRLSDREPGVSIAEAPPDREVWCWWKPGHGGTRAAELPAPLWEALVPPGGRYAVPWGRITVATADTRQGAFADLSRACVRYGRGLAGLPELPAEPLTPPAQ